MEHVRFLDPAGRKTTLAAIIEAADRWHATRDDCGELLVKQPRVCGDCLRGLHRRCTGRMVAMPGANRHSGVIPCGCEKHSKSEIAVRTCARCGGMIYQDRADGSLACMICARPVEAPRLATIAGKVVREVKSKRAAP